MVSSTLRGWLEQRTGRDPEFHACIFLIFRREIAMADDDAAPFATTGVSNVGGSIARNIETTGDADWFEIALTLASPTVTLGDRGRVLRSGRIVRADETESLAGDSEPRVPCLGRAEPAP